jgi:peptide subunit release factor 1 (eRF1)
MTPSFSGDVRTLLERSGPFVSVYLNTEGAREDAAEELELRWRGMRDKALEEGASETALAAIDGIASGAHRKGDGLAVFAAGDEIILRRFLSRPVADSISVGATARVLRLLEWQQDNPRYAVVLSDRRGAEIHVISGHETETTAEVEGSDDWPIQKVAPGGWSQRRFQNRAENSWEANAKTVVDELAKIASAEDLDFVVIAGDVRAIQFIKEHLPQEIAATTFELATEPHQLDDIREELDKTAAAWVGQSVEETLAKFQEERGQNDLAVEGKEATFEALRKAQVDKLLISPGRVDEVAYFSRSDLTQASLDRKQLAELNMTDIEEADAADVLVRAAIGTGARVIAIPELGKQHGPREGVGALLRYAD